MAAMSSAGATTIGFSTVSADGRTRIPRAVRERLRLKPGNTIRYRFSVDGVVIDKARRRTGRARYTPRDPFAVFSEWAGEADEKAYARL